MQETVEQLQRNYENLINHHDNRLAEIRTRIEEREKRGLNHADLDAELAQAQGTADRAKELALKRLNDAREHEKKAQAQATAKQKANADAIEEKRKRAARAAWIRNGGDPSQFEAAYPAIREDLLKSSVLSEIAKKDGGSNIFTSL